MASNNLSYVAIVMSTIAIVGLILMGSYISNIEPEDNLAEDQFKDREVKVKEGSLAEAVRKNKEDANLKREDLKIKKIAANKPITPKENTADVLPHRRKKIFSGLNILSRKLDVVYFLVFIHSLVPLFGKSKLHTTCHRVL